jgi:hypothetical protein
LVIIESFLIYPVHYYYIDYDGTKYYPTTIYSFPNIHGHRFIKVRQYSTGSVDNENVEQTFVEKVLEKLNKCFENGKYDLSSLTVTNYKDEKISLDQPLDTIIKH